MQTACHSGVAINSHRGTCSDRAFSGHSQITVYGRLALVVANEVTTNSRIACGERAVRCISGIGRADNQILTDLCCSCDLSDSIHNRIAIDIRIVSADSHSTVKLGVAARYR